jgi:predicted MFS family arabinose efflux permease
LIQQNVLEVTPAHRTASAVAVVGLFVGPVKVGLPLLGARLAEVVGYPFLFACAAALTLLSLLALVLWVPEPRAENRDALSERDEPHPGPRREDSLAQV